MKYNKEVKKNPIKENRKAIFGKWIINLKKYNSQYINYQIFSI